MAMASARPLHSSHGDPFLLLHRAHMLLYACFLLLHFRLHLLRLLSSPSLPSLSLFLSDLVLAIQWALFQAFRWNPVRRREYPERLPEQLAAGLPRLDVFVCTADPRKEPPMGVANTALSVLGFEYPADKLSVYVSDDGGSQMTLYAFVEAARFARSWLPFCRENRVVDRSPERLFRRGECPSGYYEEMKVLYEEMKDRVDKAMDRGFLDDDDLLRVEKAGLLETFCKWTAPGFEPTDHPTVIEVLLDSNRDRDIGGSPLPNLIYMSREKKRVFPHHFKAGALNSLLRVSGLMSNAPVILTLDCDTVSNDPMAPQRALCYLLDKEFSSNLAFVQFPQRFAGLNRDDTYGETFLGLFHANPPGMDGLGGPNYVGSSTFFARRALHDAAAPVDAAVIASSETMERAHHACSCASEHGTEWGSAVGFRYGSLVEDYYTGLLLHSQGWRSVYCNPERAAFLGNAPLALNDSLCQVRRWAVGLLEVALSRHCPLVLGFRNRGFALLSFCYAHYSFWPFWSFPILTYAILPQVALFCKRPIFPKAEDRSATMIYWYLFLAAYAKDLLDFLRAGGTHTRWWNDQRMWMIRGITSFPAGCLDYLLDRLGFPGHGFNVTSKVAADGDRSARYRRGLFDLAPTTPFVVSVGTAATLSLVALVVGCLRSRDVGDAMVLELLLVGFVVANCLPVYEGMVARRDGGRMRLDCVVICSLLAGFLLLAGHYIFLYL